MFVRFPHSLLAPAAVAMLFSATACAQSNPAGEAFDAYLEEDRILQSGFNPDTASVVEELEHRTARDQLIRQLILDMMNTEGAGPDEAQMTWLRIMQRMNRIDRDNTDWLEGQLEERVWFTISEYGAEADNDAFLIVQHATHDPEFMREVLARFETLLPQGEIAPDNYALLTDRVAAEAGNAQIYGSQWTCQNGVLEPSAPIADPDTLDARRAEVGLPPMDDYLEMMPEC